MKLNILPKEPPRTVSQGSMFGAGVFSSTMVGVYGYVRAVNMEAASVKVELMNGVVLHSVRVPSREWIDETAPTVTGSVNLPPVNTYVFVLLPYGMDNTSGAVVLFSVFNDRIKIQQDRLVVGDEEKVVDVLPGNIRTTYDRVTGNYKIEDIDDENLVIEFNRADKILHVKDWSGNEITTGPDGVLMADTNGNTISMEASKVLVNGHLEVLQ